jgi:predicted S18 family serine protease
MEVEVKRRDKAWTLAMVLLIAGVTASVVLNVLFVHSTWQLVDRIQDLESENAELRSTVEVLKRHLAVEEYPLNATARGAWIYVVGISVEDDVSTGVMMRAYVRFVSGKGEVLITTSPKIGISLQEAAEKAFTVAQMVSNVSVRDLDVVVSIVANETVYVVDGPSAGGALTVLITGMLSGFELRRDVVITGTINEDGSIGEVGGIVEKALAVAEMGVKTFVVPSGQSVVTVWVKKEVPLTPWLTLIKYEAEEVDVEEYLAELGYDVDVVEASSIHEAISLFKGG